MTYPTKKLDNEGKVWRYMSLSKFIWLMKEKKLWMSRSDTLGDAWELTLAGKQLERVVQTHPINYIGKTGLTENAIDRSQRIIKNWRHQTFVNCWSLNNNESHALWQIYCGTNEGVSIQTTRMRLANSLVQHPSILLEKVIYQEAGSIEKTPTIQNLITSKRLMFEFEQEIRLYQTLEEGNSENLTGVGLFWNPCEHIESIYIHPDADSFFRDVVVDIVKNFAPSLLPNIQWSAMKDKPPLID